MKIAIVGCGNILLGDEGVGPYVLDVLKKRGSMPQEVELIELGVRGIELVDLIGKFDKIFIIDAVKTGGKPGTIRTLSCSDLRSMPGSTMLTLHDLGLLTVLKLCEALYGDVSVKIKIFGVEIAEAESVRMNLSSDVRRGASEVVKLLEKEVSATLK